MKTSQFSDSGTIFVAEPNLWGFSV